VQNQNQNCFGRNIPFFVPVFLILFIAGFFIGILWIEKVRSDRVYLRNNLYQSPPGGSSKSVSDGAVSVGSDRDSHGCIGSAGYQWCEEKGKCLRSWEEECKK
jgi:hypothetical protein